MKTILTYFHIIFGGLALISGPIAMYFQNGGNIHRISGKIYFYSMLMVFISGLIMSIMTKNIFLFLIAIFTLNLICTGYRALFLKKLHVGQQPYRIDWALLYSGGITGLFLVIFGGYLMATNNSFGITAFVFGSIMLNNYRQDKNRFTRPINDKNHWLYTHIGGMIGGYIATLTAFLVQNIQTNPTFIAWLAPTLVFTPIIIFTIRKFRKKGNRQSDQLKIKINT